MSLTPHRNAQIVLLCASAIALWTVAAYGDNYLELFDPATRTNALFNRDFVNYWLGGRLAIAGGQQLLFDIRDYRLVLDSVFGRDYPVHNWSYPPHFLLFVAPLGLLDYVPALILFLSTTLALFMGGALAFRRSYAPRSDRALLVLVLISFVIMMVSATQNGFLTAGCALLGLAWMKQRPVLAGLAFACLTVKPQLGLLIPVVLAFDRNWGTFAWATIFTAALVVVSAAVFGIASWRAYFADTVPYQQSLMVNWVGNFLLMMPNVFGGMRTLGVTAELALRVQWAVSAIFAAVAIWLIYKEIDPLRRICIALCATFVISPYAFDYDMGALAVAAAVLAGSRSLAAPATLVVALTAALPPMIFYLGRAGVPIAPLILIGGLVAMAAPPRAENSHTPLAQANVA